MLIPLSDVIDRHDVSVHGVIHAGAHLGQEAAAYDDAGANEILWIEGNPDLIPGLTEHLRSRPNWRRHRVVNALVGATSGTPVNLNIANVDMSSSVLPLGTHRDKHPEVHYTGAYQATLVTLDDLVGDDADRYNFLNMDLQGYELECLKGAERTLAHIDCIYTEVNEDELYEGCVLLPDLQAWLAERGFVMVEKLLAGCQQRDCSDGGNRWVGWGDAVFIRRW